MSMPDMAKSTMLCTPSRVWRLRSLRLDFEWRDGVAPQQLGHRLDQRGDRLEVLPVDAEQV
jgi:hypothetical protein